MEVIKSQFYRWKRIPGSVQDYLVQPGSAWNWARLEVHRKNGWTATIWRIRIGEMVPPGLRTQKIPGHIFRQVRGVRMVMMSILACGQIVVPTNGLNCPFVNGQRSVVQSIHHRKFPIFPHIRIVNQNGIMILQKMHASTLMSMIDLLMLLRLIVWAWADTWLRLILHGSKMVLFISWVFFHRLLVSFIEFSRSLPQDRQTKLLKCFLLNWCLWRMPNLWRH